MSRDGETATGRDGDRPSPIRSLADSPSRPRHAGIVLAAGASTRMGQPKALLQTPHGIPLATHQTDLLKQSGCASVIVVLGSEADTIQHQLHSCRCVVNGEWKSGRFTSVQAGLRALSSFDGCFILPVDSVGIGTETLKAVRVYAEKNEAAAVRPFFNEQPGRIAWISSGLASELLKLQDKSLRLDDYLSALESHVDVQDPAILNNVNTPDDWARICAHWPD